MITTRTDRRLTNRARQQRGAVLIIVLWTAALLTVLVAAMAAKVRLSAQTVVNNQNSASQWLQVMDAVNKAEAEILLEFMPRPIDAEIERDSDGEIRNPSYRFNGQPLDLYYPDSEDMVVRIYNHAGKISLNRIPRNTLRMLIEERLGGIEVANPSEVDELMNAWVDWTDLNSLTSEPGGAEADYYEGLEPGFAPRNNPDLETPEEILNIRGFAELFAGVDVDAAFTVYGNHRTLNLNLATREAMRLLPGMTEEVIENIIAYREHKDINNRADMAEIIPFEILQEVSNWVNSSETSEFYSVFVYPRADAEQVALAEQANDEAFFNPDPVTRAYSEVIQAANFGSLPRVMKIDPYAQLPDTAPPRVLEEDLLFTP